MISKILRKHVTLSMSNGSVLEGFISEVNDNYAELIEVTNQVVIIKLNDISFARLGISEIKENWIPNKNTFEQEILQERPAGNYSMMAETEENSVYQRPQFVRTMKKNDIE